MMKLLQKIIKNLIEARFLKVSFKKIKSIAKQVFAIIDFVLSIPVRYVFTKINPVCNNKIIFMTYNNDFICNPKYICEEIIRQNLPLDIVWATTKKSLNNNHYPPNIKCVTRGTYDFFKEVATAKIWVDNAVCFTWNPLPKKKEQIYLQTWHGSMGLKRIGKNDVKNRRWNFAAKLAGKWTNVCISNSTFETDVFRQTHWPTTEIKELGHARNDILFSSIEVKKQIRKKVCDFFNIPYEKKLVLYAPTFRNTSITNQYSLDYQNILKILNKKFNSEFVFLNRFHFKSQNISNIEKSELQIYSATKYPDMQELLVAVDIGITDYSSWICDFVLTKKPGFIYAPDLNEYNQERGFYYPLDSTPFPIAKNNNELIENILTFDHDKYVQDAIAFIAEKGCIDDGHASERIVNKIQELIETNGNSSTY